MVLWREHLLVCLARLFCAAVARVLTCIFFHDLVYLGVRFHSVKHDWLLEYDFKTDSDPPSMIFWRSSILIQSIANLKANMSKSQVVCHSGALTSSAYSTLQEFNWFSLHD
jgi:hypothetical protein